MRRINNYKVMPISTWRSTMRKLQNALDKEAQTNKKAKDKVMTKGKGRREKDD